MASAVSGKIASHCQKLVLLVRMEERGPESCLHEAPELRAVARGERAPGREMGLADAARPEQQDILSLMQEAQRREFETERLVEHVHGDLGVLRSTRQHGIERREGRLEPKGRELIAHAFITDRGTHATATTRNSVHRTRRDVVALHTRLHVIDQHLEGDAERLEGARQAAEARGRRGARGEAGDAPAAVAQHEDEDLELVRRAAAGDRAALASSGLCLASGQGLAPLRDTADLLGLSGRIASRRMVRPPCSRVRR